MSGAQHWPSAPILHGAAHAPPRAPFSAPGPPPNASIALLALEVGRLQTQMQRQDAALAELRAQVRELRAALDREK